MKYIVIIAMVYWMYATYSDINGCKYDMKTWGKCNVLPVILDIIALIIGISYLIIENGGM